MNYRIYVLLFLSSPALAEVSDKVMSIPQLWTYGIIGSVILFTLIRYSAWFVVLGLVVVLFFCLVSHQTIADPFVGPAIVKEQGNNYIVASYGSVILMVLSSIVGVFANIKRRRNAT